jgi:spermidine synthase
MGCGSGVLKFLFKSLRRMRKYSGRLIYQIHDDEGILEIIEARGVRSLYFGSESRQSCMLLNDPDYLYIPYVRAMMSWNLFGDSFDHALIIGLGGGSLAKYLLHTFTAGQIRVVEYRKSVVKIAHSHFALPLDSRLKCIIADGGHYIKQAAKDSQQQYDLLMVDAFDHEAMSASVDSVAVFDACRILLKDRGIMVMNLWGTNISAFTQTAAYLEQSFDSRVMYLPVEGRGNVIAIAFAQAQGCGSYQELLARSKRLEEQTRIEFPVFLKALKKNNSDIISQFMKVSA